MEFHCFNNNFLISRIPLLLYFHIFRILYFKICGKYEIQEKQRSGISTISRNMNSGNTDLWNSGISEIL